jgi:hypothetical protein
MKKKFNFWIILFIFNLLSFNAYALDSRCHSVIKNIINNELSLQIDELDYNKTTDGVSKAEASIYVTIKNISQIDVKDNTFESDLVLSVSWKMKNLHPLIKEYMEISVKNDDHLLKMASIVQRLSTGNATGGGGDMLTSEEMDQLQNIVEEISEKEKNVNNS